MSLDSALLAEARAARIKTSDLVFYQSEAAAELSRRIAAGSPLSSEASSSEESDDDSDDDVASLTDATKTMPMTPCSQKGGA